VFRRSHQGTTIGWIAGGEHIIDIKSLPIVEVLQRLLDERPEVHVTSVGLRLPLRNERYEHISRVSLAELSQQASEFDIAIAPLADNDFNRSRSNIKLKEYAAGGTPWLASPIGPYAQMGEQQGGRLVPDDGWYEALSRLIDKPRERRKLAKRAARWAKSDAISKHLTKWEEAFARAIELRARRASGVTGQARPTA
jgi:glycosyltransferase involved in cell wall biosynthesis